MTPKVTPKLPADEYEPRFHALIEGAAQLGSSFDTLLAETSYGTLVNREVMPDFVVFELVHLTRLQFEAACRDLADPWFSHAAPSHLRGVLEGCAYVAFILTTLGIRWRLSCWNAASRRGWWRTSWVTATSRRP